MKVNHTHASIIKEIKELFLRTLKNLIRNPNPLKLRMMQILVMALIINLVFWDLGYSESALRGKLGFMAFISFNQMMPSMFSVLLLFILERPIFLREYTNKTYSIWTYFISKTLVETPFQLIFPCIFSVLIYFTTGMTTDWDKFFIFTFILLLDTFFGISIGFFFGCFFENSSKATTGALLIMLPFLIFNGFIVNLNTVPKWIRWISYLSPMRYSVEALFRNEVEGNSKYKNGDEIIDNYNYNVGLLG